MENYRLRYLLALLVMGALPAWGQDVKDEGNVTQEQHLTPIPPTSAPVSSSPDSNATDTNGNTALVRIDRFEVKGNTLLSPALIERLLDPYKGNARSYTDIQLALEALEGAYRSAGYSAVHVVTPEQEITGGTVTLQVIETVVGKVILKGNEHYDKTNIRNALPALVEGSTPSARVLSENIQLANQNPTRQIDVVLALGEEENTVDAQVNVQDSSPHKVFLTMDNTGNASTGMYRTGIGYQNNNMFNRDQALTLNYITSPNHVSDVTQVSVGYRIPVYSMGDSIDLLFAHSDTNTGTLSTTAGSLAVTAQGDVYSAHYNHYLPRQGDYTSRIIAGLDYRPTVQNCAATNTLLCGTVGDVNLLPLTLTYGGTLTKPTYITDYSASVVHNLPGGEKGGSDAFNVPRPGAQPDYNILHLNGSLSGVLPRDWQYRLAGNAQYTNDGLLPSEKLGLVGANAVRGFIEREFSNDNGYVLNIELYTPELASEMHIKDGSFRFLGFVDSASGWDKVLPGELANHTTLGSVGLGFRYTQGKYLTVKFDLAKVACGDTSDKAATACTASNVVSRTGDTRGHIGMVVTW
jgi:hemolysin activation/secretion protein